VRYYTAYKGEQEVLTERKGWKDDTNKKYIFQEKERR